MGKAASTLTFHEILVSKMTPPESETPKHTQIAPPSIEQILNFYSDFFVSEGPERSPIKKTTRFTNSPYSTIPRVEAPSKETPLPPPQPQRTPAYPLKNFSAGGLLALATLGLSIEASEVTTGQIKSAFRTQAMNWHPDLHPEKGNDGFVALKEALDLLMSEIKHWSKPETDVPAKAA